MNRNKKVVCEQVKKDLEILIDEFKDLTEIAKQGLEQFDNFQSSHTQYVSRQFSMKLHDWIIASLIL